MWITIFQLFILHKIRDMNIEHFLEDLEAQFVNEFSPQKEIFTYSEMNQVHLISSDESAHRLIAPIIARDFVAGLDLVSPTWHIFPFHSVRLIRFEKNNASDMPKIREFNKSFFDFLLLTQTPSPAKLKLAGEASMQKSGQLTGLMNELIIFVDAFAKNVIAVPLQSIQQLSIESVDKLNGDF